MYLRDKLSRAALRFAPGLKSKQNLREPMSAHTPFFVFSAYGPSLKMSGRKNEKRLNSAQTGDISSVARWGISTAAHVANNTNNHAPTASKEKAPTVSSPDALKVSKINATAVILFGA